MSEIKENLDKLPVQPGGKDEMNLAEFPFAVLAKNASGKNTIEFADTIRGNSGRLIKREWTVTGSEKYGLPRAGDEEMYVALMKLTKDDGFQSRTVCFSRYKLIKLMGWDTHGESYQRIEEGLQRLQSVRIRAKNAFWDNEAKKLATVLFGIIESVKIYDERPNESLDSRQLSSFSWNEILFNSFKAGFIKSLDVDFYFSLESSISKRLYRFLDKNRYGKAEFEFDLQKIAALLPIQDRYPSQIKRRLESAHAELIARGFLLDVAYNKASGNEEKVVYKFGKLNGMDDAEKEVLEQLVQMELNFQIDEDDVLIQLEVRGITHKIASELVNKYSSEQIWKQIEIFDWLSEQKSPILRRNPAGFLRKSIEEKYEAPTEYLQRQEKELVEQKRAKEEEIEQAKQARIDAIQKQIDDYREQLSDQDRMLLQKEAIELIDNDKAIKKEFVSELLIRAKESEIIRKRLNIEQI